MARPISTKKSNNKRKKNLNNNSQSDSCNENNAPDSTVLESDFLPDSKCSQELTLNNKCNECNENENENANIIVDPFIYKPLNPINNEQRLIRRHIDNLAKNIKGPCCRICLDTLKDGKLIRMNFTDGTHCYCCEECHYIQNNLL